MLEGRACAVAGEDVDVEEAVAVGEDFRVQEGMRYCAPDCASVMAQYLRQTGASEGIRMGTVYTLVALKDIIRCQYRGAKIPRKRTVKSFRGPAAYKARSELRS